jgi:AGCS family alanine or glycine:cation symporter
MIPILLICCGIFFLCYLRAYPLRSPRGMLRALRLPSEGDVSPFRALMLALAGTLGVGNIVGVASAVAIGGAGSIFWMWVSALIAMVLKYAEILLAVSHRRADRKGGFFGGAYYYIKDHFESCGHFRLGAVLSAVFALLVVAVSLSMGCVVQGNAVARAVTGVTGLPTWICGGVLACLTLPVIARGSRGVSALTELLVPIMSAGYVILSAAVLITRREAVGDAFCAILRGAFSAEGMAGGAVGFLTSRALRVGTMRGLLSNEAGCGTAPTAHASACAKDPAAQGVWGILEVFVDTILLCTATALVILVSYPEVEMLGHDAVMMAIRAYSVVLGGWSEWFFCLAILCFGYATLLCWASYGQEALRYLSGRGFMRAGYVVLFGVLLWGGSLAAPDAIWDAADFSISALTTLNLAVLFLMRREVCDKTFSFFVKNH